MRTVRLDRDISRQLTMKRGRKGQNTKEVTKFVYGNAPDGVHVKNKISNKWFKALAKSASSDVLQPLTHIPVDILHHEEEEEDDHEEEVDLSTDCVFEVESEFILIDEENSCSAAAHVHVESEEEEYDYDDDNDELIPHKKLKLDIKDDEEDLIKDSWDYKRHVKLLYENLQADSIFLKLSFLYIGLLIHHYRHDNCHHLHWVLCHFNNISVSNFIGFYAISSLFQSVSLLGFMPFQQYFSHMYPFDLAI